MRHDGAGLIVLVFRRRPDCRRRRQHRMAGNLGGVLTEIGGPVSANYAGAVIANIASALISVYSPAPPPRRIGCARGVW
jgi:hypothetical protein